MQRHHSHLDSRHIAERRKLYDVAFNLLRDNKYEEAKKAFLNIENPPKSISAVLGYARCLIQSGEFQEAIALLKPHQGTPRASKKRDVFISLSRCYRSLDDHESARHYLKLSPDQTEVEIQYAWGRVYSGMDEIDKAMAFFESIEKKHPYHINTVVSHAILLNDQGKSSTAIAKLENWIAAYPQSDKDEV